MRVVSWMVLAIAALPLHAAEVYRSVDAQGNVVYSDRPQGQNAERIEVVIPNIATSAQPAPAPAEPAAGAATAPPDELQGEVVAEPSRDEVAAQRVRNCAIAQERAERYRVSQRLYRTLPNGEREYLSDAELDEARAKADADVATWCD